MFRLKATLVATTRMRPWRIGWATDRGVDFSLLEAIGPLGAPPAVRGVTAAAEPVSFIHEDWAPSPGVVVTTAFTVLGVSGAAIGRGPDEVPETAGLRAWCSLASKSSRT